MSETTLSSKIIYELRHTHRIFVFNIAGSFYQQNGMPDCLIIVGGVHLFIEWKGPETKIRPLQERTITELKKAGANVFVVRFTSPSTWLIDEKEELLFRHWKDGVPLLIDRLLEISE